MQDFFTNVGRSTGASVIAAAGGDQYALEGVDNLENGVFTSTILEALGKYNTITIKQLKEYVTFRVNELTSGLQKPTARNETVTVNWSIW